MNATMNGRARKSLAEQIDRLDTLLDGLAENLNDAIATAVEQAVKQVLVEVLTSAELQKRLQQAQAAIEPAEPTGATVSASAPSIATRMASGCQRIGRWVLAKLKAACGGAVSTVHSAAVWCGQRWERLTARCEAIQQQISGFLAMTWFVLYGARHLAGAVLTASAAGAAAGIAAYHLSPLVAALTSGAGGFIATMAVHIALWLRQTLLHWTAVDRP